ncbi:unnamed protein product [Orchesella dallaii]|uniref:Peptidase S1 domain-containing protein n=1 Tax=Orchesella dallaii TaxID=48710 RepID=A0ABP1RPR1_9HEXA
MKMFKQLVFTLAVCLTATTSVESSSGTFIIGGEEAAKNQFPHLVRFWISSSEKQVHFCSGTLIELDLVLTSASCVQGSEREIIVVAGDHILTEVDGTEQSLTSQRIITHENFNSSGILDNDIALIQLVSKLERTDAVRPIALPRPGSNPDASAYGIVVGWGETEVGDGESPPTSSAVLQRANVRILDSAFCAELPNVEIAEGDFCSLDSSGASRGDNGSPIVCSEALGAVCGIMSNSLSNVGSQNAMVGIYVNIVPYLDWIQANKPIEPSTSTPAPTTTTSEPTDSTTTTGAPTDSTTTTGAPTDSTTTTAAPTDSTTTTAAPTDSTTTTAEPTDSTTTTAAPTDSTTTTAAPTDSTTTTGAPGNSTTTTGAPDNSTTTTDAPGNSTTTTGAPDNSTTTTGAPTDSTISTGAPTDSTTTTGSSTDSTTPSSTDTTTAEAGSSGLVPGICVILGSMLFSMHRF